ncbi:MULTISPECIES: CHAT domain-containing protein [Spirosoma]|uniref:CHAT domain-containing protein n=1 Tax=Spirosoma sordidisoli TaxID=2502893 RepID=A0A4Q2UCV4_9BACT|nr:MULTISPECIES: CHAT domain-containing protein [Spirosoma]RYC66877.1 CHAT domain-containing protein [Spirosoma sordidisoli]
MNSSGSGWTWYVLVLLCLGSMAGHGQSADSLRQRANAIYRQQPAEALRLFGQVQKLARQQGKFDLAANSLVDEATVYYVNDDYRRATTVCRAGLPLTPLADSTRFKLWASLGEMYHQRNRPDSLRWFWQRADSLLLVRPALEREARTYVAAYWGNRGTASVEQGDYRQAERCFQKRLLLLARHTTPARQAIAENQFALFYRQLGQLGRADSLYTASVRHYKTPDLNRGWLLLGLIECRLQRQRTDSVWVFIRETERLVKQAGTDGAELSAYLDQSLGKYWEQQQQLGRARTFFARSVATGQRLGGSSRVGWRGLMALSRMAWLQQDVSGALTFIQQAMQANSLRFRATDPAQNPALTDFLNGPDLFESLCWKAHLLHAAKTMPNSLQLANLTYDRAFALSDLLQASYSAELTKLFVQEKLRPAYREAVAVAYAQYRQRPDKATLAALLHRQEQGSAAVLRETLQALQRDYAGVPGYLLEEVQRAKNRLAAAKTAWAERDVAHSTGAGIVAVNAELVNAELVWNRAYQKLRPYTSAQPGADNLSRLQQQLAPDMAFLQYSLTSDSLLLTVVKKHQIRVMLLPISGAQLNQLAETVRHEAYRNPDPFQYTGHTAARALFRRVLGPVWADLAGVRRLVIVRDGPLHYLPFEVLETGQRPDDYLLRHAAITYAYSMDSYVRSPRQRPDGSPDVLSMAPFAVDQATLTLIQQRGYQSLDRSEAEIGSAAGTRSTAANASKATFLSLFPDHQVLHLATHARASDNDPGDSYIAFFPQDSSHRLYAHELGLLDLRHIRLAVLSACRTGSGSLHGGEGLLSLSRAFASAGCPQVITSLWNAHDGTTARLSQLLYEELASGLPTDVALQRAKLRFIEQQSSGGAFSPPHFWAHLVLMGTNQPVFPVPGPWPTGWLAALGTGLLAIAGYIRYRRRRSR